MTRLGKEIIQNLPCSICYECRQTRLNEWKFRLSWEYKKWKKAHFITLTYNEENVVWGDGEQTLSKDDAKKFIKALRKREPKLRYYLAGEYGTRTQRPHYHIIAFGINNDMNIVKSWNKGSVFMPELKNEAGIAYTLKYLMKPTTPFKLRTPTKEKEFQLMSNEIGKNYLTPATINFHKQGAAYCYTVHQGKKMSLPRYYKKIIFDEEEAAGIADHQSARATIKFKEFIRNHKIKTKREDWARSMDIRNQHKQFEKTFGIF